MKSLIVILTLTFGVGLTIDTLAKDKIGIQGSIAVKGKSKSEYSSLAKITLQDAIAAATKSTSGKVLEAAIDRDNGFLVYEVKVLMPDQTKKEIIVDAGNSKILLTKDKKSVSEEDDEEDYE